MQSNTWSLEAEKQEQKPNKQKPPKPQTQQHLVSWSRGHISCGLLPFCSPLILYINKEYNYNKLRTGFPTHVLQRSRKSWCLFHSWSTPPATCATVTEITQITAVTQVERRCIHTTFKRQPYNSCLAFVLETDFFTSAIKACCMLMKILN